MRISELRGLRVGVLGFGREGQATLAALRRMGHDGEVQIISDHEAAVPAGARLWLGEGAVGALSGLDVLVRSPGFPPRHPVRAAADAAGLPQTTATNLFLAELRHEGIDVIGITGSKGKSTTSTLAQLVLAEAGIPSILVGNIGLAALDQLERVVRDRLVTVMELSSYQCADLLDGSGPSIACLLRVFPEHLDWHGSVDAYYAAKLRIALAQRAGDRFRYDARTARLVSEAPVHSAAEPINTKDGLHFGEGWFRRGPEKLFSDADMALPGLHNRENAVAALSVAELVGARPEHLRAVLSTFRGLPFRLEDEGVRRGIRWVNDSLSTAPEAVAAALHALAPGVETLIAGGYDRGYDPAPLVEAVAASGVHTLILLPGTGASIARHARSSRLEVDVLEVPSLDEAVALAMERTPRGSICLFSPGAPSYNHYRSFEERGAHLRALLARHGD